MKDTPRTHPESPTQGEIEFHAVTVGALGRSGTALRGVEVDIVRGHAWHLLVHGLAGDARRDTARRDTGDEARGAQVLRRRRDACRHPRLPGRGGPPHGAPWQPRSTYARTDSFRLVGASYDAETSVWAIVCFYVAPESRRRGVQARLIEEACAVAVRAGADVIEALPVADGEDSWPYDYMGMARAFDRAGFEDAGSTRKHHRLMRRFLRT